MVLKARCKVSAPNVHTPQTFEFKHNLIHFCHSIIIDHDGITSFTSCGEVTTYQVYKVPRPKKVLKAESKQGKAGPGLASASGPDRELTSMSFFFPELLCSVTFFSNTYR